MGFILEQKMDICGAISQKDLKVYDELSDIYDTDIETFKQVLNNKTRYTQQSFVNFAEFLGWETISKNTKTLSIHKLF